MQKKNGKNKRIIKDKKNIVYVFRGGKKIKSHFSLIVERATSGSSEGYVCQVLLMLIIIDDND